MQKEKTALFIGHRECSDLKISELTREIKRHIDKGVINFLSGGQGEFDRVSARCVYEFKKEYGNIKNILVIPYLDFNVFNKELFDEIIIFEGFEKYFYKTAIPKRNEFMVKKSGYAICYVENGMGGAAKTFELALVNKLKIVNLGGYTH